MGRIPCVAGACRTTDHDECTWDLLASIPSLQHPGLTVRDETVNFNEKHKAHSKIARPITPITRHDRSIPVIIDTLEKAFA
jgi:myosin-crossreactive antigen